MRVAIALLLFACSGGGKAAPANPGSATGSAVESPPGPDPKVEITTTAEIETHQGKMADVIGTARNAKLAAAVVVTGTPVYCLGVDSWPSDIANKQVVAMGTLEQTDEFAADDGAAGTSGKVWVIRGCTYETR